MRQSRILILSIVAAVGLAAVLFVGMGTIAVVIYSRQPAPAPLPTRDEMREQLKGKTPEEVLAIVGRPTSADDDDKGRPRYWSVRKRVYDPVSGVTSESMGIWFANGRVDEVKF